MGRLITFCVASFSMLCTGSALCDPAQLPLLGHRQAIALQHTTVEPGGQPAIDQAWGQAVWMGMTGYVLPTDWVTLAGDDGASFTLDLWFDYIDSLETLGLSTYLMISTIDTNNLQLPAQFIDPANPGRLAPGVNFDSPYLIDTFGQLLDALIPHLADHGGFYLSVGNEVDSWLAEHPEQVQPFAAFVEAARQRVHALRPDLAVGATLSSESLEHPEIAAPIMGVSDAVSFTHYLVGPGSFDVRPPSNLDAELDALLALAGDKQVVFQEVGYPSGWQTPANGSSVELQREFVERLFPAMASRPRVRFWSQLHLGDWDQAALDVFADYYGIHDPGFEEFLGTLGLMWTDGTPKPAFAAFLHGLGGCPYDTTGDGVVDIDDLYELTRNPVDINGDGVADAGDANCLERFLRRHELRDMMHRP